MLAVNAIDQLTATGHILAGTRVEPVQFGVAVAVRAGAALPDISSEVDVRLPVHAMQSVRYSMRSSGVALAKLFE